MLPGLCIDALVSWSKNEVGLLIQYSWYWVSRRTNDLPRVVCCECIQHQLGAWGVSCAIPLGSCSVAPTHTHGCSGPADQNLVWSHLHSCSLLIHPGPTHGAPASLADLLERHVIVFRTTESGWDQLEASFRCDRRSMPQESSFSSTICMAGSQEICNDKAGCRTIWMAELLLDEVTWPVPDHSRSNRVLRESSDFVTAALPVLS